VTSARWLAVAAALSFGACTGPIPGSQAAPAPLDGAAYVRLVHPIFEARCATLDCHGNADRPLRLYAETGLRAADELRDTTTLTPAELDANVAAVSGLQESTGSEVADDQLLLAKPLGLMKHSGGAVWTTSADPQYLCVRGWLAGESGQAEVTAACATARAQVAIPPP
jgi:hypothetical protein